MSLEDTKFKQIILEDSITGEIQSIEAKIAMLPICMTADLIYNGMYDSIKEIIDALESSKYTITIPIINKERQLDFAVTEDYIHLELKSDSKRLYSHMQMYLEGLSNSFSGVKTYNTMKRFLNSTLQNEIFKVETKEYIYDIVLVKINHDPICPNTVNKKQYTFKILHRYINSIYWTAKGGD
jgi:hypothetical protein